MRRVKEHDWSKKFDTYAVRGKVGVAVGAADSIHEEWGNPYDTIVEFWEGEAHAVGRCKGEKGGTTGKGKGNGKGNDGIWAQGEM